LSICKKNGRIFYYAFGKEEEKKELIENIKKQAEKYKKEIKILKIKKAGEIAPYKFRWRIEIKVLK